MIVKLFHKTFLISMILLQSCTQTTSNHSSIQSKVSSQELHAVMTDRIDVLISQMDMLTNDQHRTQTTLDRERRQKSLRIADSAAELQRAIDTILKMQPRLALTPEDVPIFNRLATQLKQQSAELEDLARRNQIDALGPAIKSTKNTCMSCHTLFRDY